jgi:hypothetical protein
MVQSKARSGQIEVANCLLEMTETRVIELQVEGPQWAMGGMC